MRLAIIGSRAYPRLDMVQAYVESLAPSIIVISGGALGVDTVAAQAARARGMQVVEHLPDYKTHGSKRAPHARNRVIASECDCMTAFWDGASPGTEAVIAMTRKLGKLVQVIA